MIFVRWFLACCLAALVVACGGYRTVGFDAAHPPVFAPDQQVRVTLKNERYIDLRNVAFSGDSLSGSYGEPPRRWATAISEIQQLESWDGGNNRSALQISAVTVLAVGLLALLISALTVDW